MNSNDRRTKEKNKIKKQRNIYTYFPHLQGRHVLNISISTITTRAQTNQHRNTQRSNIFPTTQQENLFLPSHFPFPFILTHFLNTHAWLGLVFRHTMAYTQQTVKAGIQLPLIIRCGVPLLLYFLCCFVCGYFVLFLLLSLLFLVGWLAQCCKEPCLLSLEHFSVISSIVIFMSCIFSWRGGWGKVLRRRKRKKKKNKSKYVSE